MGVEGAPRVGDVRQGRAHPSSDACEPTACRQNRWWLAMSSMSVGALCSACGELATHTAPLTSRWRRVHPAEHPGVVRLQQVPDPPVCERHWDAFLHQERVPIGWCIDCASYGALKSPSPCGRDFEAF
jgi:hypothetical protein